MEMKDGFKMVMLKLEVHNQRRNWPNLLILVNSISERRGSSGVRYRESCSSLNAIFLSPHILWSESESFTESLVTNERGPWVLQGPHTHHTTPNRKRWQIPEALIQTVFDESEMKFETLRKFLKLSCTNFENFL